MRRSRWRAACESKNINIHRPRISTTSKKKLSTLIAKCDIPYAQGSIFSLYVDKNNIRYNFATII